MNYDAPVKPPKINTCQILLPKTIQESKISNPKKSFDHPRHLKSGVPRPGNMFNTIC